MDQTFTLRDEYIELDKLLKLLALAPSGGSARALIDAGEVRVDGEVELRRRRKLHAGAVVIVGNDCVRIVAA
jgi:ribosome-associated protein